MLGVIKELIKRYKCYRNPVSYYRSVGVTIGRKCEIRGSVNFGSESYLIKLGEHVRINSGVQLITHDGGAWVLREYSKIPNRENITLVKRIIIGNNVHIGSNAMIMPGVTVGNNCIVGCGAIVTRDIPDNSVAVGVPARVIETIDEYFEKHKGEFTYTKNMTKKEKKQFLLENLK